MLIIHNTRTAWCRGWNEKCGCAAVVPRIPAPHLSRSPCSCTVTATAPTASCLVVAVSWCQWSPPLGSSYGCAYSSAWWGRWRWPWTRCSPQCCPPRTRNRGSQPPATWFRGIECRVIKICAFQKVIFPPFFKHNLGPIRVINKISLCLTRLH